MSARYREVGCSACLTCKQCLLLYPGTLTVYSSPLLSIPPLNSIPTTTIPTTTINNQHQAPGKSRRNASVVGCVSPRAESNMARASLRARPPPPCCGRDRGRCAPATAAPCQRPGGRNPSRATNCSNSWPPQGGPRAAHSVQARSCVVEPRGHVEMVRAQRPLGILHRLVQLALRWRKHASSTVACSLSKELQHPVKTL